MKSLRPFKQVVFTALFTSLNAGLTLAATAATPNVAMAQAPNPVQAANVANRIDRQVGGLDNSQRDVVRQLTETYVRDRKQYGQTAVAQLENGLKTTLSPTQFQKYLDGRDYVLNGRGKNGNNTSTGVTQPQASNSQAMTPSALTTRVERAVGGLDNTQRDVVRQLSESYLRDRDQQNAAATAQFENGLKSTLSPTQYSQYENQRSAILAR